MTNQCTKTVRIVFEPNRFSVSQLSMTYAKLTSFKTKNIQSNQNTSEPQLSIAKSKRSGHHE